MRTINIIQISTALLISLLFALSPSCAETYVGVGGGFVFGGSLTKTKVDVDLDYAGKPFPPLTVPGYSMSDSNLDETFAVSGKVGHYFDKFPFIGIEGEVGYSKPDFREQSFILNNPTPIAPNLGTLATLQRQADVHDFQAGAHLMFRLPLFKRVMPYIGAGPQIHYIRIRGTGEAISGLPQPTGTIVNLNTTTEPNLRGDYITPGIQAKAGVRLVPVKAIERLAVDIEYKYNWAPMRMGQFRDLRNVRGQYMAHQIGAALVYRFGKIPQGIKKKYNNNTEVNVAESTTIDAIEGASETALLALN